MTLEPKRISLLIHTSNGWSRGVLRGIATFASKMTNWEILIRSSGFSERLELPDQEIDGVILRLNHHDLERSVRSRGIPAVNVSWLGKHSETIPRVISDESGCAEVAAKHLIELGLRSFGVIAPHENSGYSDVILNVFRDSVESAGYGCEVVRNSNQLFGQVCEWLGSTTTPIGIVAWNTEMGQKVCAACRRLNFRVPEDVAILCIEHDPVLSALSMTPLSNVDQAPTRVGNRAASLLNDMMNGGEVPADPILIEPYGVIHRKSTDASFLPDPLVSQSIRFIRDNMHRPLQVVDLQKQFSVSRRKLEHRFVSAIGRTPATEIRMAKLGFAKRMLLETDLPIHEISELCGYNHTEVFMRSFKREFGMSPGDFRRSQ